MKRFIFILLLALSLAASVNVCLADKGRDPPDPPAVPTIVDADQTKAPAESRVLMPPENRVFMPPERMQVECPSQKIR